MLLDHLIAHANPVTDKESVQCKFCVEIIPTEDEYRRHIIQVHPNDTKNTMVNTLACVMCEIRFSNITALAGHMQKHHVSAELPYMCGVCLHRCSSQRVAIEHFYEIHEGSGTLQCPFCLQMMVIWSQDKSLPYNVYSFFNHLKQHMDKTVAKKCNKCALWFIQKGALKDHQVNAHLSQIAQKSIIKNMCISTTMVNKPKVKSSGNKDITTHTVDPIFENVTMYVQDGMNCIECGNDFGEQRHFPGLLKCAKCLFTSNCSRAMFTHTGACTGNTPSLLPPQTLFTELHCICGFSADDGNALAKHLAICDRKTAYPSAESAANNTVARSMLDMLGLVRKSADPSEDAGSVDGEKSERIEEIEETVSPLEEPTLTEKSLEVPDVTENVVAPPTDIPEDLPQEMQFESEDTISKDEQNPENLIEPVIDTNLSLDDLAPPSVLNPQEMDVDDSSISKIDDYQSIATPQVPNLESNMESEFESLPAEPLPQPEFEPL